MAVGLVSPRGNHRGSAYSCRRGAGYSTEAIPKVRGHTNSTTPEGDSRLGALAPGIFEAGNATSSPSVAHFGKSALAQLAILSATCASSPLYSWSPFTIIAVVIFGESPANF
jgi:hypothetical protein